MFKLFVEHDSSTTGLLNRLEFSVCLTCFRAKKLIMSHESTPINTHIRYQSRGTEILGNLIGLELESAIRELERGFRARHAHGKNG